MYTGPTHKDPNRCYLKSGAALAHRRHSAGMTAGYPNGIAPPVSTDPWYNISRTVTITIDPAPGNGAVGSHPVMLRVINSTCANPKRMWLTEMKSVTWPSEAQLARLRQGQCQPAAPTQSLTCSCGSQLRLRRLSHPPNRLPGGLVTLLTRRWLCCSERAVRARGGSGCSCYAAERGSGAEVEVEAGRCAIGDGDSGGLRGSGAGGAHHGVDCRGDCCLGPPPERLGRPHRVGGVRLLV